MVRVALICGLLGAVAAVLYWNPLNDHVKTLAVLLALSGGVAEAAGVVFVIEDVTGKSLRERLAPVQRRAASAAWAVLARLGRRRPVKVVTGSGALHFDFSARARGKVTRGPGRSDAQRLADLEEDMTKAMDLIATLDDRASDLTEEMGRMKEQVPLEARRIAEEVLRDEQVARMEIRRRSAVLLLLGIPLATSGSILSTFAGG